VSLPTTVLLDGNVLVALSVPTHVHHQKAMRWRAQNTATPFATCASTEGTLLRVLISKAVGLTAGDAWKNLRLIRRLEGHVFWGDELSYADVSNRLIIGTAQVTDAWLAELARRKKGKVVTFDSGFVGSHADVAELIP